VGLPSLTIGAAVDHDIAHDGGVAAREQKLQRVDRHDGVAIQAIEIDHDEVGRSPGASAPLPGAARCRAAVADGEAEKFGPGPGALEAEAAMG